MDERPRNPQDEGQVWNPLFHYGHKRVLDALAKEKNKRHFFPDVEHEGVL